MRVLHSALGLLIASCAVPEGASVDDADVGTVEQSLFSGDGTLADTATIYEDTAGFNGGGYADVCIGNKGANTLTRRAFIRYSLPSIPSTATVTRVQLSLTQAMVRRMPTRLAGTLELRRVTSAWTEGAGTSGDRACSAGADVAGVDWTGQPSVLGTASASDPLGPADGEAITFDTDIGTGDDGLLGDVQAWVNGTANNGWRLEIVEEATASNARSIDVGALTITWTLANGGTCDQDDDCASGNCVHPDGENCAGRAGCVCCNAATCGAACQTCHRSGQVGSCVPRAAGTSCRAASCTDGAATSAAECNGVGTTCPAIIITDCAPYANCVGTVCDSSCASAAECEATAFCDGSSMCVFVTNECTQDLDDCVALATCDDPSAAVGDFTCTCPLGYAGNGRTSGSGCTDRDECTLGIDDCDVNATCANTTGGFTCMCNGPAWVGDGVTCSDYNECNDPVFSGMCDTNATCTNTAGSFGCACDDGYLGDGRTCTDIDECTAGTDDCHANATCTNTSGSFTCACNTGYAGNGVTCTDFDECNDPIVTARCAVDSTCENLPGDWRCNCNPGFRGTGFVCDDIDECSEGSDDCDPNATCTNTVGRWACACNDGYEGSGVSCADIDECTRGTGGCRPDQMCVNQPGATNRCDCAPGYSVPDGGTACEVVCGDAARGRGEECDDGNEADGDGCSGRCAVEAGWACIEPRFGQSECSNSCGDRVIDAPFEDCDNGSDNSNTTADACRTNCRAAGCGDTAVDTGEACDDGDANSDTTADACRTTCTAAFCGDGVIDSDERCDLGGGVAPIDTCTTACASSDAGIVEPPMDGGCGCRTSSDREPSPWLLAIVGVIVVRRSRSRRMRRARMLAPAIPGE